MRSEEQYDLAYHETISKDFEIELLELNFTSVNSHIPTQEVISECGSIMTPITST